MTENKQQTVAEYLTYHINNSDKTQRQIGRDIGYAKPNIITMIKQGYTKLPLEKIGPLANALEIAPDELFYKVMKEYMPETFEALKPLLEGLALSPDEENLLTNYRKFKVLEAKRLAGNKRAKPFKIDWFDTN